jgi:hypothetical protein
MRSRSVRARSSSGLASKRVIEEVRAKRGPPCVLEIFRWRRCGAPGHFGDVPAASLDLNVSSGTAAPHRAPPCTWWQPLSHLSSPVPGGSLCICLPRVHPFSHHGEHGAGGALVLAARCWPPSLCVCTPRSSSSTRHQQRQRPEHPAPAAAAAATRARLTLRHQHYSSSSRSSGRAAGNEAASSPGYTGGPSWVSRLGSFDLLGGTCSTFGHGRFRQLGTIRRSLSTTSSHQNVVRHSSL